MNKSLQILDEIKIETIKKIQLSMLSELDIICKSNNIKYCLAYGSLLGAVRHNGYIPWDDDIDVWMTRSEYNRLVKAFVSDNNKLSSAAFDVNYPFVFSKIINVHTKLVESKFAHVNFVYGVYIDIFVLDSFPKSRLLQELLSIKNYFYYAKIRLKYFKTNNKFIKFLQHKINVKKSISKIENLYNKFDKSDLYKSNDGIYCLWINKKNRKYCFDKSLFNELESHKFENLEVMIPKNYDLILKKCYGDYMTLPPENDRNSHNFSGFEEIE